MRFYSCLFLFFFFLTAARGQSVIDSLERELKKTTAASTKKVDLLNELGYENWIIDSKKSISQGKQALQLAEKLSYPQGIAKAKRVLGVAYWTLGQPKAALGNLTEAEDAYRRLNDEEGMANCLLNIGMVYADIRDYSTALRFYDRAIEKFSKLGLKGRIATAYTKIGIVKIETHHFHDAQEYLTNALDIHSENNFTYGMAEAHNKLGRLFLELNETEQANHHLRKAIVMGKQIHDEDGIVSNLILFGKLLRMEGDYEASEAHLDIALERASKKQLRKYRLEALNEYRLLKEQQGQLPEALQYYDLYTALKDSLYDIEKSKQVAAMEFKSEIDEKNRQVEYLKGQETTDTAIRWLLLLGILIISALSWLLIRSLRQKNKSQQELLASNKLVAQTALENERLKKNELEEQLHFKNRELTSYSLNFVQKNELLEQLEEKLAALKAMPAQKQAKAISEIEKIVRSQKSLDRDWEDFKAHFEQVHGNFLANLKEKFPQLSSNDLKIAALTRLNMNIKETSNILGISPDSVKTARYRLRKKLGMEQEADLISFLVELEKQR